MNSNAYNLYKCGVYTESWSAYISHRTGRRWSRGHAVEIVDYGNCSGENFWVVKNSWGDRHEHGYFRIRRGDLRIADKALKIVIIDTATPGSPTTGAALPVRLVRFWPDHFLAG